MEKLSDIELEHEAEKVKTVKMMERTVKTFLERIEKKVRVRKIKIICKQQMDEARKISLSVIFL